MNFNFNITVCASGGGGNFQSLIDNQKTAGYKINQLIVDRECGAIDRAKKNDIKYVLINKKELGENFFNEMHNAIPVNTNLIVLAGFMPILSRDFCLNWKNKIINTHPSLLPKYGGKGMYGCKVQEAIMEAKEKYAGCTVHYVDDKIDNGKIILQKVVEVNYNETPWELGGRIFKEENKLLVEAVKIIMSEELKEQICLDG